MPRIQWGYILGWVSLQKEVLGIFNVSIYENYRILLKFTGKIFLFQLFPPLFGLPLIAIGKPVKISDTEPRPVAHVKKIYLLSYRRRIIRYWFYRARNSGMQYIHVLWFRHQWTSGFYKMQGISGLSERLSWYHRLWAFQCCWYVTQLVSDIDLSKTYRIMSSYINVLISGDETCIKLCNFSNIFQNGSI